MIYMFANYFDTGRPVYHPKLMLKVLLYSYTEGILNCRNIKV
ncbi:MAG: transposase [Candidatus Mcinerneyibacterium aminivorans]|uniref:Transposase n=1 Tax=Candidatus Mcinerneyibacterium aminivorans TaxID=2703815 RepID=A0A5D0MEW9_9BACT|nr:MAG: transposase [Candidatus Mcinerneyibacterium aminivorans]